MELNNMAESSSDSDAANKNVAAGRWTNEEHNLFILGLQIHNKQWKNIADMVKTRTVVQIRTHAQKYFQKMEKANPSGVAFPNGKSLSENGLYNENIVGDAEDGTRLPNYRSQSIGSTDSADSSKFGRSVSLGSDVGNDSDADRNASLAPGAVPHCSSFPSDMLMNSYMGGIDLKPRSATMTDAMKPAVSAAVGGPKKRSRDNMNSNANKANNLSMTSNPPKSPKRSSTKHQQQQMAQNHSAPNLQMMQMRYAGGDMLSGGGGLVHSASECDELDMISLLEKIDWNAIPSPQHRSPASSPFTDSAASLSSSSGHICYKTVLNKCINTSTSPLQFSHIDQVNVNEELTDSDVFDVFDEYYRNVDLKAEVGVGGSIISSSSNGLMPIAPGIKSELLHGQVLPVASPTFQQPPLQVAVVQEARKEPRVWFSSSVIGELKTKTNPVQPGFSIGHGILKPWRDRKPVSQLPPLRTLTSNTPPVVIPTQSLTLLDSTFCNYPPALYLNDALMDVGGGYVSDSATLTSGESSNSNSNSAYCIGSSAGGLSLDSPSMCSEDVLGSPKTFSSLGSTSQGVSMLSLNRPGGGVSGELFPLSLGTAPQSPAVKKRGRPRKNSLTSSTTSGGGVNSGCTTPGTVKSRSCSNLSASNAPMMGIPVPPSPSPVGGQMLTGSYLAGGYPCFPALGSMSAGPPTLKETRARKNSLTSQSTGDLMMHLPYDDFMMSCREVDPTNSFAHQLSHEHDPDYVMPVSHSGMMGGMGVGGVGMVGGSVLGSDGMFDHHFHGDSTEMDCSMSFGFDEHELQIDAAAVGGAVAAANLSRKNSAAIAPPVKQEESEDLYDMLAQCLNE